MTTGGKILLSFVGLLLTVVVILAQVAYRLECTVLSYTYISRRLDSIIEPLNDPDVHEDAVRGVLDWLQGAFSLEVPVKLEPYALRAATAGLDVGWFGRTGRRIAFNTAALVDGKMSELSWPIYLDGLKLAFLDIARFQFEIYQYVEIDREVSGIPSSYDLADLISPDDLEVIGGRMKRANSVLFILEYAAPVALFVLCFVCLRLGSGFLTAGGALLSGGTVILAGAAMRARLIQFAGSAVADHLPSFLHWLRPGVEEVAADVILGLLPAAIVVAVVGLVLGAAGVWLIIFKGDPHIKIRRSH